MTALTSDNHTYDQIVIGAGSAAAMYLNTLRNYDRTAPEAETMPSSILVIGMEDPWAGARGYSKDRYIQNINQARQLFEHGTGKTASMDIDPVDRTEWAETNRDLIKEVTLGHVLTAEVAMVKERARLSPRVFLVETKGLGSYAANKIVIAEGAGIETTENEYHHVPNEALTYRQQSSNPKPNRMVKSILNDRQSKGRGFTPEEMGVWDYKVAEAERNAKAKSTQTRGFAYNSYYNNGV